MFPRNSLVGPSGGRPMGLFDKADEERNVHRGKFGILRRCLPVAAFFIAALMVAVVVLAVLLSNERVNAGGVIADSNTHSLRLGPTNLGQTVLPPNRISDSVLGNYSRFGVAADNGECSAIARDILLSGGNAIDAAVAADLCTGVMNPQSSGIGGGFFLTLYNRTTRQCSIIDAREVAPSATDRSFFLSKPKGSSQTGWLAVAVPGAIDGLVSAHRGSGRLPWASLLRPTIDLCRYGHMVSIALAQAIQRHSSDILVDPGMREIFFNNVTQRLFVAGEKIKRPKFAETLELLANSSDPRDLFYRGSMAQQIANEFKRNGGIITAEDLQNYKSERREALMVKLSSRGLTVCGPPPPSSAGVAMGILNILDGYRFEQNDMNIPDKAVEVYHTLIEAMKFGYSERSELGDSAFVRSANETMRNITSPEWADQIRSRLTVKSQPLEYYGGGFQKFDHGTAHISIVDAEGNAVSMTTTLDLYFGARRISESTGIIWNDEMDDFSIPNESNFFGISPSPSNFIEPGKRPMSSMSPLIFFDESTGDVRLVLGAAGGSNIISGTAYVAFRDLWLNETIKEAIDAPRFHNQLRPYRTDFEGGLVPSIVSDLLKAKGQIMSDQGVISRVMGVEKLPNGRIYANCDYRKQGGFTAGE